MKNPETEISNLNDNELVDFFSKLPKTDLHCHLDGSLRLETIYELSRDKILREIAGEYNLALPFNKSMDELHELLVVKEGYTDLVGYLNAFPYTCATLQTPDALERAAYELAIDNAKENILYFELRFAPMLHVNRYQDGYTALQAVDRGLERAEKEFNGNFRASIITVAMRNFHTGLSGYHKDVVNYFRFSTDKELAQNIALETARLTVRSRNKGMYRIVGFDLAGAEKDYPPNKYTEAFHEIINNLMPITVHAGEAYGPDSIMQAVVYLGAVRIGHGTKLLEEPRNQRLINYIKDSRIAIEACLSSNLHTAAISSLEGHPFKFYLENEIRVSLCTDNRLISNTTLSKEFLIAYKNYKLTLEEIRRCILYGFKSSFLPYDEKRALFIKARKKLEDFGLKDQENK